MSPLDPPVGVAALTVGVPKPLLLAAIASEISVLRAPPPESPPPAVTMRVTGTAPNEPKAAAAVFCPVPPDAIGNGADRPEMVPPDMVTALSDCVAIVPRPKFTRAASIVSAPVPPAASCPYPPKPYN